MSTATAVNYKEIIDNAIKAIHARTFYAQYPESPKAYGEEAPVKGLEAYNNQLGKSFNGLLQQNLWHGLAKKHRLIPVSR